ncbi:MAG: alkyl sulfatase BDS1-like metallo-beta-lactamase superfamily hydrolase [Candidatus Azotimanducaceae bacterium]|jgi:alkyl sulfatase BDS1-like metallo-beta-lactamase superfamily hydrolase
MTDPRDTKAPSSFTTEANTLAGGTLSFDDQGDWERATRGKIAEHPTGIISGPTGGIAWNTNEFDFMRDHEQAPDSVHPSLWRHGRLNAVHGLFEVAPGVWQCRGYDLSNITFIKGKNGWIVIDPLTTAATAAACLELANQKLGTRPVTAVLYTHSHADHYGGILGVTTREDVEAGNVRILAPEGFLREAVSENLLAGPVMNRRALYQFGILLPKGPLGHVDCGLGKTVPLAPGDLIGPTEEISHTGTELDIDGVRVIFQSTPGTEAPAEMNFLFPDHGALCIAENCTHTLHNALPFRGAQVRDTLIWSKYIQEALDIFGDQIDLVFSTHNWPRFGRDDAVQYLELQRDLYRWVHDQTLRRMNHGETQREIAEDLVLPDCFARHSHTRGYYGTIQHNAKAIYQRYIGWYDGNPSNLNPHTPAESGKRYVAAMGGADAVVKQARGAFEEGDYRWVTELLNHVVFAAPDHEGARLLQADSYEQMGYQSESGPWRDSYLTAAMELRSAGKGVGANVRNITDQLDVDMLFDLVGVRLRDQEVGDAEGTVNWLFTDVNEKHVLGLAHCTIHHRLDTHDENALANIETTREDLAAVLRGERTIDEMLNAVEVTGDPTILRTIFSNLDVFTGRFGIVEP